MMADLLSPAVRAAESYDYLSDYELFDEEAALLCNAVPSRRREFATVRGLARTAMMALGLPPVPILLGPGRAPVWPSGVVGSMTHCPGYNAAAVASRREIATLGIDAEPDAPLPDGVFNCISRPEERAGFVALQEVAGDRLLFSAKESVYKAWYPLTGRWLGHLDALLTVRAEGTFIAEILLDPVAGEDLALQTVTGRWASTNGFVMTAVVVPAGI